jgi:DNA-binding SARP family transcriptional activator/WD40 repeat protein
VGADVRVRVLGPVTVVGAAPLQGRDRRVLGALVAEAGRVCPPDRLAEAVYRSDPPATWRKVVHGSVGRLRHCLGAQAIATVDGGYRLELGDDQIDVRRFERLVAEGERLAGVGEPERAALRFGEALELVAGEPFADLDGWEPGVAAAARVAETVRRVEEQLVTAWLAAGQYQEALRAASAQVVDEPLREQRWASLALAEYRAGRQGEALRTIQRARRVLADELGLDPGAELVGLERSILAQDPHLAGPVPVEGWWAGGCPYRGLAAYDIADVEWFFGREQESAECLGIVDATGFVAIVGASGSGKSSLARAGVAPALRRHGRDVAVLTPGPSPDSMLAHVERGSVLVVDQLEGLFVLCEDSDRRTRFAAAVCRWAATAPVVITLRADHLGEVAELAELAARVQAGIYLLGAMGEPQLRAAIEGPAAKAGLRLEPGLVDLLVRDVAGEPGALPLLSHALAETYERREGPVLTAAAYRAVGGVQGAVARAADQVVDGLAPDGRRAARDLFLRLVIPTDTSEPIRQRIPRADLAVDATTATVLDALVTSRLVIADRDTVEVAHEAVCRAWPRLRAWLDEDRDGLRLHRHLAQASREWEQSGRDASELYRGPRLVAALDWTRQDDVDLNDSEQAFLAASSARRDAAQLVTRRRLRRLRAALVGVGLLLIAALVASALAVRSNREARNQRDSARDAEQRAQDERETARLDTLISLSQALRPSNRGVAALLAVEAHRRRPDASAWSALLGTFTANPGFSGYQFVPAERFVTGALVPETSSAVVALDGRDLMLLDLPSGELVARFPAPTEGALTYSVLRVSSDGQLVAQLIDVSATEAANALIVYEVASGRQLLGPVTPTFFAGDVDINADGSLVAVAGGPTGELAVYRVADGELLGTLPGLDRPEGVDLARDTAAVAFGDDGRLYLGSMLGAIRVIDPTTMVVVERYEAPLLSSHNQLIVTDAGLLIAAGDQAVVAIDTSTGDTVWTVSRERGNNACSAIAVAATEGRLYCRNRFFSQAQGPLGSEGRLEERDLATGLRTGVVFDAQQGSAGDVAVTDDGRDLVTFSANTPVITRWRLDGTGPVTTRVGEGWIAGDFDPTGRMLLVTEYHDVPLFEDVVGSPPTDSYVWDTVANQVADPLDEVVLAGWVAPGRLGGLFTDGTAGFYDLITRRRVEGASLDVLGLPTDQFTSVDGTRFYIGYQDGRIQTLDSTSGEQIGPVIHLGGPVGSVSATTDGARIVATSAEGGAWSMTIHDALTGDQLGEISGLNAAQVGPDNTLIGATVMGEITRYDLETLTPLASFPGVRGLVVPSQLHFSADGNLLMAGSQDQTVSIYDVASHTRLGDPIPTGGPTVLGGSLRSDGKAVAVGGNGIAIWDLDPEHLATAACRLAGRNLTPTEWDT